MHAVTGLLATAATVRRNTALGLSSVGPVLRVAEPVHREGGGWRRAQVKPVGCDSNGCERAPPRNEISVVRQAEQVRQSGRRGATAPTTTSTSTSTSTGTTTSARSKDASLGHRATTVRVPLC